MPHCHIIDKVTTFYKPKLGHTFSAVHRKDGGHNQMLRPALKA